MKLRVIIQVYTPGKLRAKARVGVEGADVGTYRSKIWCRVWPVWPALQRL